ncbi:pre-peptidase C-terminal domain-containing protein, partial [Desulforhopalus vacuolatus]|uniref:beta strand repeat-containing protein n=1 Tax=Desulforhopalus vacuolatus TaxID=40414 RepID=UPI001963CA8C
NGDASITGYAGENDFYTFVAQHPGTATIDLTGLSSDIDLRLLNSSGSRLDSSSSDGSSSESVSYNLTSGETYYVKVDPYGNNTSDYNLSINTVAAVNDIVNGTTISGGDAGNSRTGATAVSLDSNGDTSITGYAGENDFYTFVAQSPGTATINLTGLSSDIDLKLLSSTGSTLKSSSSDGSSSESVSYNLISGETYYVKVDPFGASTSDYNLSINSGNIDIINGTTVSGSDAGDSRTGAAAVSLDSNGDASITGYAGENDFYTFVAQHPGTATIDLTGLSSDIDLRLLNSSGSRLDSSSSDGSSSESVSYNLTSGETYYVKVDPYKSNTSDYNLSINTVAAVNDIINGTTISGGDAGNSRTGAAAVSLDSNGNASITGYAGDNDYYTFVAQHPGTATIGLTGLSSDINLKLLSSSGSRLKYSSSDGISSESVSCNLISGETYYVKVDPYRSNTSDYNLSINSGNIDIINGTTVSGSDAGNSRTGAAAVSLDSNGDASITGYAGENDFYTFVAEHHGTATINLTGLSSAIDLRLLNSSGSRLESSTSHSPSSGGISSESVSCNLTSGKTYYVKVDPYRSNTSDYNLSINTVAAVNDIINGTTISGGDAGNSRTEAAAVSLDSNGDASITGYAGDNDFYTFVAQDPGTATINLTELSSDINLKLLSSSGSTLKSSSSDGSSSESVSYNLISGETYYVKVDPYGPSTSDYNLSINSGNIDIINGTTVSGSDAGDSRTGAAAVSLDSNGDASITGYAGENDFYTFVAQHPGTATIDLTGLSSAIDLRLLNSSGSRLDSSSSDGSSNESVSCNLTSGETYYVKVDPYGNNTSDYNLSINTVAAVNDIVNGTTISGGDAGNSRTGAAVVSLDSNGDASITGYAGDNDFYTFVAQNPGTATIDLTGLSSAIDLRLLNSSGSRLDSSSSDGSSSESVSYNLISGETYYVKVDPYGPSTSDYNLSINSGNTDIINGTTVSGGDAGDSRTGAAAVSLDINGDASITGYAGENDYYTFVAQHPGTATINLTGLSSGIDLMLLSSFGSLVKGSYPSGSSSASLSYNLTSGNTYYVWVRRPDGASTSDYNLSINSGNIDIINGTTVSSGDAGNSLSEAALVSLDSNGDASITGYVGENDFYTFVAQNNGIAIFNLTGLSSDIDLMLLSSSESTLKSSSSHSSSSGGSSSESISYNLISGETYYVKVDPYGPSTSDYNLSINTAVAVNDIINGATISGGDAGDSRTEAAAVSLNSNGDASITGYAGDDDFYTFVALSSGTASFELKGLSSGVYLNLLSSSGSLLDFSASSGSSSESVSYNFTSGETYYVQVKSFDSNTNASDYNLSINTPSTLGPQLTVYRPQYSVDNHFSDNSGIYFEWENIAVSEENEESSSTGPGIRINLISDWNEDMSGTLENDLIRIDVDNLNDVGTLTAIPGWS